MNMNFDFGEQQRNLDAKRVATLVYHKIAAKNLFAWRYYIDEVIQDTVLYMTKTDFKYSVGIYVYSGMCMAVDKARYCSAKKRRHNFECMRLDDCKEIEDKDAIYKHRATELYIAIEQEYGQDLAGELYGFIFGRQMSIDNKTRRKVQTPEFREFLQNIMQE